MALLVAVAACPGAAVAHPETNREFAGSGNNPSGAEADQILVGFRSGTSSSEREAAHEQTDGEVESRLTEERVDVVDLPADQTVAEAKDVYENNPDVAFVEPNYKVAITGAPNDPFYTSGDLWALNNTGKDGGVAEADIDWADSLAIFGEAATVGSPWPSIGTNSVAIIDSGIDWTHPDLQGQGRIGVQCGQSLSGVAKVTLLSQCSDGNGHGTHVSGTVAALANNSTGITGVAPGTKILPCKAIDSSGSGTVADVAACINWAVQYKPASISMSLGGTSKSTTLETAINAAANAGIVVVASAGNEGTSTPSYPAAYDNVIAVGATDNKDARASFSNYGSWVDITAPGVGIISTLPGGGYGSASGTSMAAPHVAAAAADVAWKTGKTGSALRSAIESGVDDLGSAGRDVEYGYGRLNLCKALGGAASCGGPTSSADRAPTAAFSISESPATAGETVTVDASGSADPDGTITNYEWDFKGDGQFKATGEVAEVSYSSEGKYNISLTVTDDKGQTATTTQTLVVNSAGVSTQGVRISAKVTSKMSLRDALKKGIKVRCNVGGPANCDVTARVPAKTAKKISLKVKKHAKFVVLGENDRDLDDAGSATVTVRIAKRHRAALLKAKSVVVTLKIVATDEDGNESAVTRKMQLINDIKHAKKASKHRKHARK